MYSACTNVTFDSPLYRSLAATVGLFNHMITLFVSA